MKSETMKMVNRILIGLMFLVAGILKVFVIKPAGVVGMLSGIGFPAPTVFAWILILSEIIFGACVLFNVQMKWAPIPLMIILLVATFTVYLTQIPQIFLHLVAVSNIAMFVAKAWEE